MTLSEVKKLCAKYNILPARSKGQNFLLCENVLDDMIKASSLTQDSIVLEIGPGFGVLTERLARVAKKVIAIELDSSLLAAAKDKLSDIKNIEFVNMDVLKLADEQLMSIFGNNLEYKIVANLPYNITGAFLKKFLSCPFKPVKMVLMVQKEVAERICAPKGEMSLLSVSVQYFSVPKILDIIGRSCFYPVPKIDSAIVEMDLKKEFLINKEPREEEKVFFQIVRIGFSARRKMLKNNLLNGLKGDYFKKTGEKLTGEDIEKLLQACSLNSKARAQDLSLDDWKRVQKKLKDLFS